MKQAILLEIIRCVYPVKRRILLHNVRMKFPDLSDRKIRLLIAELIQDGEPISSSEKGYSIIRNVDQLRNAVNYLKAKSKSLAIRGNTLIGNYDQKYQDAPANLQFKLF